MNRLSRFQKMVEELKDHPQVQLLNFHTFPPVEPSQFDFLEQKYSIKIPSTIFDFYKKTNGLQLRWIFKNNEYYSHQNNQIDEQPLAWNYFGKKYRWEDGGMMILPLEKMLEQKVVDAFSQDFNMIFAKEDFQLSMSEDDFFSNDFFTTNFESYLEFLIAGKGLISRRNFFYKKTEEAKAKKQDHILTPLSFWTTQRILHLDQALLKDNFPFCDQVRFSESQINRTTLLMLAKNGEKISEKEVEKRIENHHQFLLDGGVEGEWMVLEVRGIVTAFYHQSKETATGKQINFERKNLTKNKFEGLELPFANFCTAFAEGVNFSKTNFEGSIFSDAFLNEANFCNSNLTGVDFSRSDLRNADFQNTNLSHTDFENCDLRGANFKGAKMEEASFVGAILSSI